MAEPQTPAEQARSETMTLMLSRVGEVYLHQPLIVDGSTDLVTLCRKLSAEDLTEALVQDGERLGMFTTTRLREAVLMDRTPSALQVRDIATFPTVEISINADLHQAMVLMLRHRVHRLVVRHPDGQIAGILGQLDLMGFVANNAHLIAAEASRATSVSELKRAADQIEPLIATLRREGVRVEAIAELVGELNRAVFRRLWELVAPEALRSASCLIVMGSEGRGEQIIRTDQDNGLILADDLAPDDAAEATAQFTQALIDFGYPRCPGGIMASNEAWRQPLSGYRQMIGNWIYGESIDGPMNLAIFMDALVISGDPTLLANAKAHLSKLMTDSDAYMARFAASMNFFAEDRSWWSRLPGVRGKDAAEVDIKKLGLFPIVQGARALALRQGIDQLGTAERLAALSAAGHLSEQLARDATDALRFLMGVKLDNNLRQIKAGLPPDNIIRLGELGTLDRQSLREALSIVTSFRSAVNRHFRLEA